MENIGERLSVRDFMEQVRLAGRRDWRPQGVPSQGQAEFRKLAGPHSHPTVWESIAVGTDTSPLSAACRK